MIHTTPSSRASELYRNAGTLLPTDVRIAVRDPRLPAVSLTQPSCGMSPKRQLEFTAGRAAAETAMKKLGVDAQIIPMGSDRSPQWPAGLVGSISHTQDACIAVIGRSNAYSALAVDIEPNSPLDPELTGEILTASEARWIEKQAAADKFILARLLFSAKECAYKCQYPYTKQLFGFDGLQISLDQAKQTFRASFTQTVGQFPQGHVLHGRYATNDGLILTVMALPRRTKE